MTDTVRIYVGTDPRQGDAELTLEYSVRKHSSLPVEFVWMRAGEGVWGDWRMAWQFNKRDPRAQMPSTWWHTQFTCFRYAIPEVSEFKGRAIYMDSDMLVLDDIAKLWRMPMTAPWKCVTSKRTCVSLIDCAKFKDVTGKWWPALKSMKARDQVGAQYRSLLDSHRFLDATMPERWNSPDILQGDTAVLHFTTVETQPWKPWPEVIQYREHPRKNTTAKWQEYFKEAVSAAELAGLPLHRNHEAPDSR